MIDNKKKLKDLLAPLLKAAKQFRRELYLFQHKSSKLILMGSEVASLEKSILEEISNLIGEGEYIGSKWKQRINTNKCSECGKECQGRFCNTSCENSYNYDPCD